MKINNKTISETSKPLIVAKAGINYYVLLKKIILTPQKSKLVTKYTIKGSIKSQYLFFKNMVNLVQNIAKNSHATQRKNIILWLYDFFCFCDHFNKTKIHPLPTIIINSTECM